MSQIMKKDYNFRSSGRSCFLAQKKTMLYILRPGARFSKVPIINGPGKQSPFTLKIEVSIVLHLA